MDAVPTTAYLMLYTEERCRGNCGFCPQARESKARSDALSRIYWPKFKLLEVQQAFENLKRKESFKRICIQGINYAGFFEDLIGTIKALRGTEKSISVSVQPLKVTQMRKLRELGVERIGIPFDAATKDIFHKVKGKGAKGPYKWENYFETIKEAQRIFGHRNVSTHLIIGLGETDYEAIKFMQEIMDAGVLVALFTFTPVKGTTFENIPRPHLFKYRKMQLARYFILKERRRLENFKFDDKGTLISFNTPKEDLKTLIKMGIPFLTSGCPGCNRPYYNERPGETLFNYPRPLLNSEIEEIIKLLEEHADDFVAFN